MIPRPIESMRIARKRVPKPAFSVVAAAGMVVDVIAYPLPMRAVYWQIPNVLGQTSHSAINDAQAAFTDHFWGKGEGYMLTFFKEEEGQGLVEYALIIAVIAIAVIVAMVFLRGQIQNIFSNIGNNLT